jgi:hypothetical protein
MYMGLESAVESVKKPVYLAMVGAFYLLYAAAFLGIMYVNPKYIANLDLGIQTFVCLFLIYKFHPFRTHKLEPFDSNIIFASAGLLLANMGLSEYVAATLRTNKLIKSTFTPLSDINITHI